MSRSYRHSPFHGICAGSHASEKADKRKANRSLRRESKRSLRYEDELMPDLREVSNVYTFQKDGKTRLDHTKDYYKRLMRK